jgi:hypothetical protein
MKERRQERLRENLGKFPDWVATEKLETALIVLASLLEPAKVE